jgi:tetratricopeptide (TPR) repeat protein
MTRFTACFILQFYALHNFSLLKRESLDSMVRIEAAAKQDTDRLKTDVKLSHGYFSINPDSFFLYTQKGLALAKTLHRRLEECTLDLQLTIMLTDTGNYALAMKFAQEGLSLAREIPSTPKIIDALTEIGRVYDFQSDFVHSADYFYQALEMAKQLEDHERLAMIGTNLAAAANNQGDYKKGADVSLLTIKEAALARNGLHEYKGYYLLGVAQGPWGTPLPPKPASTTR